MSLIALLDPAAYVNILHIAFQVQLNCFRIRNKLNWHFNTLCVFAGKPYMHLVNILYCYVVIILVGNFLLCLMTGEYAIKKNQTPFCDIYAGVRFSKSWKVASWATNLTK